MNAFHNWPYVMSTNNLRAKEAKPLTCYELSQRYGNRDASKISWNYVPLLHPASCMLPKVQRPFVGSEDFLKIGGRSNDFPTKIYERSSSAASRSVAYDSSGADGCVGNCRGKGESVSFERSYGRLESDPRRSKSDLRRSGVYGLDLWQHPVRTDSGTRDRPLDSGSRTRLLSLDGEASPGDSNRRGRNEKTRIERCSVDGSSEVGDGEVQNGSTVKFNRMFHFRERLSLLQQQQQLRPKTILNEPAPTDEHLSLGNERESKTPICPDEKRSGGLEPRPHEASLSVFPPAEGHVPLSRRASEGEVGQKTTIPNGCSEGGNKDVSSALETMETPAGCNLEFSNKGELEPMDTETGDELTDLTNRSEDSPGDGSLLSDSGKIKRRRKRARRHQKDDQSKACVGVVEPMNIDEPKVIGHVKDDQSTLSNYRGTKRLLDGHHGSPVLKKARSCHAHDPLVIDLSCDTRHPIRRKTSVVPVSPIRDTQWNGPFGSLVAPCHVSKQDTLSSFIWEFYERQQQSKEMYINKIRLRDELYAVMKTVFPYCGLYVIGSSMNGFGSNHSDMDLCLMLSHNEIDQRKEATDILRILRKTLSLCSFLKDIRLIQAKVPILKFTDSISRVECDLNINNSVGIRNTHLLNAYSTLDWRVSPLVLFVKQWAKSWDINDASQGTISSYSLALMVIHYLQQGCHPHLLPSLQQKYPHKFDDSTDIRSLTLNEKLAPYSSPNKQSLGELFIGFVSYFTDRFSFEKEAISVRLGRAVHQSLVLQFLPKLCGGQWKYICIEEPFNLTNTAYSVFDSKAFRRILDVFRGTNSLILFGDGLTEPSCIVKEIKGCTIRRVKGGPLVAFERSTATKGYAEYVDQEMKVLPPFDEATTYTTVDIFTADAPTLPKSSQDLRVALIAPLAAPATVATGATAIVNEGVNVAILAPLVYRSRLF